MIITAIKKQTKRQDRASIYVDGKYSFSLATDQLLRLDLKVGQPLSTEQITQLKEDSAYGKLRDLTYKWLSLRRRSKYEIDQYLNRKTRNKATIDRLMKDLEQNGYVDDNEFARAWIRHRTFIKPISKLKLKQELLQKRVPKEIIEVSLNSSDLDDVSAAKDLIAKRGHRYKDQQKLMAYLSRQGFSYGVIKQAMAEVDQDS